MLSFILSGIALIIGYCAGYGDSWKKWRRWALRWKLAALIYRIGYKKVSQVLLFEGLNKKIYPWAISKKGYFYLVPEKPKEVEREIIL